MVNYSVYLHIPFCRNRCGYCDFNTYAGQDNLIPAYTQALCAEIGYAASQAGTRLPVHTVFFGGGTPSLLPAESLARILAALHDHFDLLPGAEISLEANPGTLSLEYLQALRSLGINRLSLGVQSANPDELRLLERQHDYADVIRAVTDARHAGFDNLNLDLIFGLPHQPLAAWQRSLELALGLHPEHFSLYALTLEHGTPLAHLAGRGLLAEPDPDLAAEMYEWASERLDRAGYAQYEISNWGRRQAGGEPKACRHNLQYWRNQPYFGFGAGAHGYIHQTRTADVLAPAVYIRRMLDAPDGKPPAFPCTPATASAQPVDRQAEIGETMMMGLRLTAEGVSDAQFQARFGQKLDEVFGPQIERLGGYGLLEWTPDRRLRLTEHGRLLGNQVFMEFV